MLFWLTIAGIIFVIGLIGGIIGLIYWNRKRYKFKIEVRDENDDVIATYKARAVVVRKSEGITSLLYIKKLKKYIKFPPRDYLKNNKIKMYYRPDGELSAIKTPKITIIDVITGKRKLRGDEIVASAEEVGKELMPLHTENIKQKMALAEVVWVDEDMRLSHVSTAKIIKDMFNFYSFIKEHGAMMLFIIGILMMGVVVVLISSSLMDYYKNQASVSAATEHMADNLDKMNKNSVDLIMKLNDMINKANNIQTLSYPKADNQAYLNYANVP